MARVWIAATSLPAPGSVRPHAPSADPLAKRGRYWRFWAGLPNWRMWPVHSELCEAMVRPIDASPQAIASIASTALRRSSPAPPHSGGTVRPNNPRAASFGTTAYGNVPARSHAEAWGRSSAAANSRTVCWMERWASSSSIRTPDPSRLAGAHPWNPSSLDWDPSSLDDQRRLIADDRAFLVNELTQGFR